MRDKSAMVKDDRKVSPKVINWSDIRGSPQNGVFSELRFPFPRRFLHFTPRALPKLWL